MMRRRILVSLSFVLLVASASLRAEKEPLTQDFVEAFKRGDAKEMSEHFAKEVRFVGDHKFIGHEAPLKEPVAITKQVLTESYSQLIDQLGEKRWTDLTKKLKPTSTTCKKDGELNGIAKKGDIICDMHFREAAKGARNGYDEAVIFLFRKEGDSYKVVFHYADY